jgi:hypothetical protein
MHLEQGSIEFLQQLATFATMNCHEASLQSTISLFIHLMKVREFQSHLKLLLDKAIIPSIDGLKAKDLLMVLRGMQAHKIGSVVQYDLLATEFARKVNETTLAESSKIAEVLAYGNATSTSCLRTMETLVFSYVEALSLMDD